MRTRRKAPTLRPMGYAFSLEDPLEPRVDADPSRLRRFGRMLMYRGERATRDGDFLDAAAEFERAAWAYEIAGELVAAAEATLELGSCLLYLNLPERLSPLAGRIANLAAEAGALLPPGGYVSLRVWATILRRGDIEPDPLLHLIRERRRIRRTRAPRFSHPWALEGLAR